MRPSVLQCGLKARFQLSKIAVGNKLRAQCVEHRVGVELGGLRSAVRRSAGAVHVKGSSVSDARPTPLLVSSRLQTPRKPILREESDAC